MIKKFFWGMVSSGLMMAAIQISPFKDQFNKKFKEQILVLKEAARQRSGAKPQTPAVVDVIQHKPKVNPEQDAVQAQAFATPTPTLTPRPDTQNIDGKEYVLIQGKYLEYNADGVYEINGERVFYKKMREPSGIKTAAVQQKSAAQGPKPATGTIPLTPGEVIQALENAKAALAERERVLDGE